MRACLQGPELAMSDKERGPGALKMRQPSFISDIPSAGMVPPQVCAPLCNAPACQQRRQHVFLLVRTRLSKALCGCRSSYNGGVQDMLLAVQPTLACTGRGVVRRPGDVIRWLWFSCRLRQACCGIFRRCWSTAGRSQGCMAQCSASQVCSTLCSSPNSHGRHAASPGRIYVKPWAVATGTGVPCCVNGIKIALLAVNAM
jgi:hypothetical protein